MLHLKLIIAICFVFCRSFFGVASDSTTIQVHFLYGSKPKHAFKDVEKHWFGGLHGGHVGIQVGPNRIIDFVPAGGFHYVAHKDSFCSRFATHANETFWFIFGGQPNEVKKLSITIPVSMEQKKRLDSIAKAYRINTPYDYAFIGMRCGSAAYDILSQLNIVKKYSHKKTYRKIFYPKKLRKLLIALAEKNHWMMERQEGTTRRKWEKD